MASSRAHAIPRNAHALDVLEHATTGEVTGTYNVAGDGIITLSQALRRLGRPSIPLPSFAISTFGSTIRQTRVADFSPEQLGFLTYGRGIDTTRMRTDLGFTPAFSTAEAFADFATTLTPTGGYAVRAIDAAASVVDPAAVELMGGRHG